MTDKVAFTSGAVSTGVNIYELASKHGFFSTPAYCVFTVMIGLVFCVFGGITVIMVAKWMTKMADKIKGIV